jgi:DNA-nicking Smr family endonuclease
MSSTRRPKKKSQSLADLGVLLKKTDHAEKPKPNKNTAATESKPSTPKEQEADLFVEAMADVSPMHSDLYWQMPQKKRPRRSSQRVDDPELNALKRLIDSGEGFRVADTPEYMEAAGPGVDRSLIKRLHQGRYAVQDHVDLHGLISAEAEQVLSQFIHNALASGKRMVLVIHGRGLSSPGRPVLKNMVYTWLTRGPLRRYILAFASARPCDGGAGATYVLLRKRPWTKKKK